jgi:hypothetical protein
MEIGIFLIGKDNLSVTGFLTYIGDELGFEGVEILNRSKIAYNHENGTFLVCLNGENLEEKIKKSIEQGKKRCSNYIKEWGYDSNNNPAIGPQLDFYKLIGLYESEEDARNSFLALSDKTHEEITSPVENILIETKSEKQIRVRDIEDLDTSDFK